jgi:ABC-type uncharacterized transport system substrate-binding protein
MKPMTRNRPAAQDGAPEPRRAWVVPRLALLALVLAGLAFILDAPASTTPTRVLVLTSGSSAPYQEAYEGVKSGIEEGSGQRVQVSMAVADGSGTLARTLQGVDLVIPVGARASRQVAREGTSVPVIFTLIPEAEMQALRETHPGSRKNWTRIAPEVPAAIQLEALSRVVPGVRRIGVIHGPRTREAVENASQVAEKQGIELHHREIQDAAELPGALRSFRQKVDALWTFPDPLVLNRNSAEFFLLFCLRNGMPVLTYSESYVRAGALMGIYVPPRQAGALAASLALRILAGESPSAVHAPEGERVNVAVHRRVADHLGISLRDLGEGVTFVD